MAALEPLQELPTPELLKAIAKWEGGGAPMQNGKHGSDALNVEDVDDAG